MSPNIYSTDVWEWLINLFQASGNRVVAALLKDP